MIPLTAPSRSASPALPSLARTGLARGRLEVRSFFADRESVIFTFALPVILLFVFGQIFRGDIGHTGVPFRQYFAAGVAFLGLRPPATPGRWFVLCWVLALGGAACAMLGVALSSLPRSAWAATAVFSLPYLVLSFISGVYAVFSSLPRGLQQVAALFPLKWLCQGLRAALLPDSMLAAEPARSWELGRVALVLAAWFVAGLVLCMTTFRWREQE
jgi:hypothetical protein